MRTSLHLNERMLMHTNIQKLLSGVGLADLRPTWVQNLDQWWHGFTLPLSFCHLGLYE